MTNVEVHESYTWFRNVFTRTGAERVQWCVNTLKKKKENGAEKNQIEGLPF